MCTEVKIPYEPAPADPEWMIRRYAGLKLNAEELDQYFRWEHDKKLFRLQKTIKAPSQAQLIKVMDINTSKKNACVHSQNCTGWNYDVYEGVFSQCGPLNPFFAWVSVVDERQFEESIDLFMDQYEIEVF